MNFQFEDRIHGLNIGQGPMVFPFVVLFRKMRGLAESHLSHIKGLVCGSMFGSSAALPFLYPLKLRSLCLLDFGFFVASAILFAVLNGPEIAVHGHYTLIGSIVVVTLILISQRNSLEAFGPYIPVLVALSLLAAVHVVPWFETYFHQRNGITLGERYMATRGHHVEGSYRAAFDPTSIRSSGGFHEGLSHRWSPGPLELEHMHLNGEYQTTLRLDSPENSSSLDLELGLPQDAQSSTASAGSREPFIS